MEVPAPYQKSLKGIHILSEIGILVDFEKKPDRSLRVLLRASTYVGNGLPSFHAFSGRAD